MGKKHYPNTLVTTEGKIIERIADTAFRAILPNGKETIAFVEKKNAQLRDIIKPGDTVSLSICPSDFNRARVDALVN